MKVYFSAGGMDAHIGYFEKTKTDPGTGKILWADEENGIAERRNQVSMVEVYAPDGVGNFRRVDISGNVIKEMAEMIGRIEAAELPPVCIED